MNTIREDDLEFSFPSAIGVFRFDNNEYHATSTLKRVDFIVEYESHYLFIEVKDPANPDAKDPEAFSKKFKSGALINSLAGKFRDTHFFRSAQGKNDRKIFYLVLLSIRETEKGLIGPKIEELKKSIPLRHYDWAEDCAASCSILDLEGWKKQFGENSIRRISEGTA